MQVKIIVVVDGTERKQATVEVSKGDEEMLGGSIGNFAKDVVLFAMANALDERKPEPEPELPPDAFKVKLGGSWEGALDTYSNIFDTKPSKYNFK